MTALPSVTDKVDTRYVIDHSYHLPNHLDHTYHVADGTNPSCFPTEANEISNPDFTEEYLDLDDNVCSGEYPRSEDRENWEESSEGSSGLLVPVDGVDRADESSGGEWSVTVFQNSEVWCDPESAEDEPRDASEALRETDDKVGKHISNLPEADGEWTGKVLGGKQKNQTNLEDGRHVEVLELEQADWLDWKLANEAKTFHCDLCEKQYQSKSSLSKHRWLHHRKRLTD